MKAEVRPELIEQAREWLRQQSFKLICAPFPSAGPDAPEMTSMPEVLAAFAQSREARGEWVPVGERLPDEDELVLVSVWCESDDHDGVTQRWQEVHEATIYKTAHQLIATTADGNEYGGEEVEAWMPLPPSPTSRAERNILSKEAK